MVLRLGADVAVPKLTPYRMLPGNFRDEVGPKMSRFSVSQCGAMSHAPMIFCAGMRMNDKRSLSPCDVEDEDHLEKILVVNTSSLPGLFSQTYLDVHVNKYVGNLLSINRELHFNVVKAVVEIRDTVAAL
jgi:hypothetical protein